MSALLSSGDTAEAAGHKSTSELSHEISNATDIEDYLSSNRRHMLTDSLSEYLQKLLSDKNLKRSDVARASLLDRSYLYQIFAGEKTPSRDKLLAIAFGLGLSDDETQKLLKIAGNGTLYARNERDAIILFSLRQHQTLFQTNELLFAHNQQPLY